MKIPKNISIANIIFSIILAIPFTIVSKFIGIKCGMAEPGGVNEGWGGFPIPYSWCGVWGEDYYIPFVITNFIAWVLIFLGIIFLFKKLRKK